MKKKTEELQFRVSVRLPNKCSVKDMQWYIDTAVSTAYGRLSQTEPMSQLDPSSVVVTQIIAGRVKK